MERRTKWIAIGLGAPVLALLAVLATRLELAPREREVGLRGEAARNPLLALERLLDELGLVCEARESLTEVPTQPGVMFWRASGRFTPPRLVEQLDKWVQDGSHLIVLLPGDGSAYEQIYDDVQAGRFAVPIASQLGLVCETVAVEDLADDPEEPEGRFRGWIDGAKAERGVSEVVHELDLGFGARRVRATGYFELVDTARLAEIAAPQTDSAHVASFVRGAGRVSVVASDAWARNLELGEFDHAGFAWDLAWLGGEASRVWIVRGERPPGLLSTLARYAWRVLLSLAVAVALAIWRSAARFGPPIPDALDTAGDRRLTGRREFAEHIAASADYLWRIGARRELLAAPRKRLEKRLQRRWPELSALEPRERRARLAEASGLEPQRVQAAMDDVDPRSAADFVRAVRDLEQLRKHL
jgi:hypothetical protein